MRWQLASRRSCFPVCLAIGFCAGRVEARTVYVADVWPARVARAADGRLQYTYDLSAVKTGQLSTQIRSELGEKPVAELLSKLPATARLAVAPDAGGLALSGGDSEHAALVPSFAKVSAAAMADSVERTQLPGPRSATRLIPSVDMLLWKAKQLDDGLGASIEVAAENGSLGLPLGRRELWNRVLEVAVSRYQSSEGEEQEAALLLAARLGASNCLDSSLAPQIARRNADVAAAISAESNRLKLALAPAEPSGIYRWSRELACIQIRERVLNEPLPASRTGLRAALLLIQILEREGRLDRGYAALQKLRDSFFGAPREDLFEKYRSALSADATADAPSTVPEVIERLRAAGIRSAEDGSPPLFARPETPLSRYVETLRRTEKRYAPLELALGIQEGRIAVTPAADSAWSIWRLAPFLPLLRPEQGDAKQLMLDAAYRSRLLAVFYALISARDESAEPEPSPKASDADTAPAYELAVRLMVPPQVSIEPLADVYGQVAAGYARLEQVLMENGKASTLQALRPGGGRANAQARMQVREMRRLFLGLEILAARSAGLSRESKGPEEASSVAAAERFVAHWREDPELAQDARFLDPSELQSADKGTLHSGILGISRRELEVSFSSPPDVEWIGGSPSAGLQADPSASELYLLPVLTTGIVASARPGSLDRARFQAICDKAAREQGAILRAAAAALNELGSKPARAQASPDD